MKIESVNDLRKVIKLMRAEGVDKMKVDGVEIELGLEPVKPSRASKQPQQTLAPGGITDETKIDIPQQLTDEQLLYYSVAEPET